VANLSWNFLPKLIRKSTFRKRKAIFSRSLRSSKLQEITDLLADSSFKKEIHNAKLTHPLPYVPEDDELFQEDEKLLDIQDLKEFGYTKLEAVEGLNLDSLILSLEQDFKQNLMFGDDDDLSVFLYL
jgi:hypothetical protein